MSLAVGKVFTLLNTKYVVMSTLEKDYLVNKIGEFCSEEHYDEYLKSLSKEEYIELQHSLCVCSDD